MRFGRYPAPRVITDLLEGGDGSIHVGVEIISATESFEDGAAASPLLGIDGPQGRLQTQEYLPLLIVGERRSTRYQVDQVGEVGQRRGGRWGHRNRRAWGGRESQQTAGQPPRRAVSIRRVRIVDDLPSRVPARERTGVRLDRHGQHRFTEGLRPVELTRARNGIESLDGDDRNEDVARGDLAQDLVPPVLTTAQPGVHPRLTAEFGEMRHQFVDVVLVRPGVRDECCLQGPPPDTCSLCVGAPSGGTPLNVALIGAPTPDPAGEDHSFG